MTKHVYLLNGNSNESLTRHLAVLAEKHAPEFLIEPDTVAAAPRYIGDPVTVARAAAAILDHAEQRFRQSDCPAPDGVLLACFGDPGLGALRASLDVPVVAMLDASVATAIQLGRRFSILTAGGNWPAQITDILALTGTLNRCSGCAAMRDEALDDDEAVWRPALQADLDSIHARYPSDVIIVGGALAAGRAAFLRPPPGVRLVDGFAAALAQLGALMRLS